jgi:DNA polymerase V
MFGPPSRHGDRRPGAGRRFKYGEPTRPIRVPRSLAPAVERWLAERGPVPSSWGEAVCRPAPAPLLALVLYGARVPAGFPSPAEDHVEGRLDLNQSALWFYQARYEPGGPIRVLWSR